MNVPIFGSFLSEGSLIKDLVFYVLPKIRVNIIHRLSRYGIMLKNSNKAVFIAALAVTYHVYVDNINT